MQTRKKLLSLAVIALASSRALATTYTATDIGLTGSAFVGLDPVSGLGVETNTLFFANSQGIAVGSSTEYTPGTNATAGTEMWYFNGSNTAAIGLLGSQYQGANNFINEGPGSTNYTRMPLVNYGFLAGNSARYDTDANHTSLGYDTWIFNTSSGVTTPISLPTTVPLPGVAGVSATNLAYSFTAPTGGTKEALGGPNNTAISGGNGTAAGTITAYFNYNGSSWQSTATDAWYFDGASTKIIGLTTGNNVASSSTNSAGAVSSNNLFYRSNALIRDNALGQVLGYSNYWNGATSQFPFPSPYDIWLYDPKNVTGTGTNGTQVLAPPSSVAGESYQGNAQGALPTYLNDSGQVAAQFTLISNAATNRSQPLSADAWLSTSGNTGWVQLGLTSTTPIYNFIPATTGSGTGGSNFGGTGYLPNYPALNNLGQATGFTARTAVVNSSAVSLGQDAWVYYPTGTNTVPSGATAGITQVGLLGGAYEATTSSGVNRTSNALALSNSGAVAGVSSRFQSSSSTSAAGQDAWYYDPANGITTSTEIGLTGTVNGISYEDTPTGATNNFRYSTITAMNQTGMVGGTSIRLPQANSTTSNPGSSTNGGQDAWVYSAATGKTYDVDPNSNASVAKWFSTITYISDTGVAIGYDDNTYTVNGGTPTITKDKLFEWYLGYDSSDNLYDLPTFQYISSQAYSTIGYTPSLTSTGSLIGYGGLSTDNSSSYVPLEFTPVPEPASLGLIASGTLLLLGRRRRKA
jgi:hypothetical protein